MDNQRKLSKLCNIRTDLRDDYGSITSINNAIQDVANGFDDLLGIDTCNSMKGKIEGMKEPYEYNDSTISSALYYCQEEINRVSADIKNEQ